MWWKWTLKMDTGAFAATATSYSTISNALIAAMYAAIQKGTAVIKIEIYPTKS